MRVDIYLSELLYRYQRVGVSGFGGFMTEIQSAHIENDTHTFFPPNKKLSFNPSFKKNDGLLVHHVANHESISHEKASEMIEKAVSDWKYHLNEFGFVTLRNIGKLYLNVDKNIVLEAFDYLNYDSQSFGLTSFISPSVTREIYKKEVEALEEKAPIAFTPEKRQSSWMKYAAIIVFGVGTAAFFGNQWYTQKIKQDTLIVEQSVQKQVENKIQEATFFIQNPLPSVTLAIESEKKSYHIVGGAFLEERNAQRTYQALLSLGYNAKILEKNNYGLYPVIYGSYKTMKAAEQARIGIQKEHNQDAWILIKE